MKVLAALILLSAACVPGGAQTKDPNVPPDNSKVNQRDRNSTAATADRQKPNKADRTLAQEIRKAIVADKNLSTYAHNVKVIVQNGTVTLKGPVRSEQERQAVLAKARAVAGDAKVVDELSIAS
jgi:osmotically-inducible protein OsmY